MSEYLNRCTNTSKFSRTKRTVSRPMCFHLQAHHKCSAQNKTMDTSMMHLNIHSFFKGFFQIHVVFHLDCKKQKKRQKPVVQVGSGLDDENDDVSSSEMAIPKEAIRVGNFLASNVAPLPPKPAKSSKAYSGEGGGFGRVSEAFFCSKGLEIPKDGEKLQL